MKRDGESMIVVNNKLYRSDELKERIKLDDKDFYIRYCRGICDAYERIKFILFGAPCGCRPIDVTDVKMKAAYSKNKIINNSLNLELNDIDFILDEYERLDRELKSKI